MAIGNEVISKCPRTMLRHESVSDPCEVRSSGPAYWGKAGIALSHSSQLKMYVCPAKRSAGDVR